ncbi:MAG: SCO family protein [Bacteriovoracaceae bacterium]
MTTAVYNTNVRQSNLLEKLVLNKWFWVTVVCFFFSYPIVRSVTRTLPPPLPMLYKLPNYQLTNEEGKSFGTNELKGKTYIANFIFTSCKTVCPNILVKTQKVQHRLRGVLDRVNIISFSVDPETDTPAVLKAKATELKAKPFVWHFLTGERSKIKNLLIDGFKVPMGEKEVLAENIMEVAHAQKYVLVDGNGYVRGYYPVDTDGINHMMIDVGLLINRNN